MKRNGVGSLILFLSAQVAANFAPEAAANQPRVTPSAERIQAPRVQTTPMVLADPSWDAFVFASAATAVAIELAAPEQQAPAQGDASWAFLAPEPQFDYLAALHDVGMARQFDEALLVEHGWLS
jgi:hypothetical protein